MKQLDPKAVWMFFFRGRSLIISFFLFYLFTSLISIYKSVSEVEGFVPILVLALIFILTNYVWAKLSYKFYRYELRKDGFRKESGVIWKKYATIPYDRIQNVDIYRGILARILGLSDLHIQTAGASAVTNKGFGMSSEGRLLGLSKEIAEQLRDELINKTQNTNQGL